VNKVIEETVKFIKTNKKLLIQTFANPNIYVSSNKPFTFFMAGSPGAGKTEFSKTFIDSLIKETPSIRLVRIDPDEIRDLIPQYKGGNAYQVQGAAALGVQKLFDYVQEKKLNALVDGTFWDLEIEKKNIDRALNKGREVGVIYVYQDPLIAWDFTKKREVVEGRKVTKEFFIRSFFLARLNVREVKRIYKGKITVNLIMKDYKNEVENVYLDIADVDKYLKLSYNEKELTEKLL